MMNNTTTGAAAGGGGGGGWLNGIVKGVPAGDSLLIMAKPKGANDVPRSRTITLSYLMAPKLAPGRGGVDEPFAWDSREFLRKLCIGKEVVFRVDNVVPSIRKEFGSVFLGDNNVASLVVASGWAKVKEQRQQRKGEVSQFLTELLRLEEQAKEQCLGRWSKVPGASEASIRDLPPSAVHDPASFDAMALLGKSKGSPLEAIVESVPNGSMLHVYLLPQFQYVGVLVAGVQAPGMGRNSVSNGNESNVSADPFGPEAKHFTETCVLHRDVRIVLESVDKRGNLIGSVHYPDGESAKDLGLGLVENGLAKYVKRSAVSLKNDAERKLKSAELQAKKARLRMWTNYVPPSTNSKPIHNENFTGKVMEVVNGECIIVSNDSVPSGDPSAERRVNLSSIRAPKMGNVRKNQKPEPFALDAKEYLRTQLIGRQVNVFMEYTRKVDGLSELLEFGSVFLDNSSKDADNADTGKNVAEHLVARGYATVIQHRDFEERSNYYDALLSAESRAKLEKLALHSGKESPVTPVKDMLTASAQEAREFLPFLRRSKKMPAVIEYVFSGHRYKVYIPGGTCSIAFSLSGVRCQGRNEPYSDEAIAFMRQKILQRNVEIEVETVDRTGTFLGTLWESKTNVSLALLESGLAKIQTSLSIERIHDGRLLAEAESCAKQKSLKIWKDHVEEENASTVSADKWKLKEELMVVVTEVLAGGKLYVQSAADEKVAAIINEQISSLDLQEPPEVGTFNPKRGAIVLAQFTQDDSWNRALVVNAPKGRVRSLRDKYEVFYLDYGNQEVVQYRHLRPLDRSVSSGPGCAQMCSLAHIKIPSWTEQYGEEAALMLVQLLLPSPLSVKDGHESTVGEDKASKGTVVDEKAPGEETSYIGDKVSVQETDSSPASSEEKIYGEDNGQEVIISTEDNGKEGNNEDEVPAQETDSSKDTGSSEEKTVTAEDNGAEVTASEDKVFVQETATGEGKASSEETAPSHEVSVGEDKAPTEEETDSSCEIASTDITSTGEGTSSVDEALAISDNATFRFRAVIEGRDKSVGKVLGHGSGTIYKITLVDMEKDISINATMLKEGLARLEKMQKQEPEDRRKVLDELKKYQEEACKERRGIWASDDGSHN